MTVQTFTVLGSGGDPYTISITAAGRLECFRADTGKACPGWIIKRGVNPRYCKHQKQAVAEHGLTVEFRDGWTYVLNGSAPDMARGMGATERAAFVAQAAKAIAAPSVDGFIRPMLAGPVPPECLLPDGQINWPSLLRRFANDAFVMEEKFDGHRVILVVRDGTVLARSRPGAGKTEGLPRPLPPHIVDAASRLQNGTYDGELILPGGQSSDVVDSDNFDKLVFVVFDVLRLLDINICTETQAVRRSYLKEIFSRANLRLGPALRLADAVPVTREAVAAIWARGGEGAIIKRLAATYRPCARSADWIKIKSLATAVLTITGYEAGKLGPYSKVALVDADGNTTSVKTLNNAWLRRFAATPAAFIGRKLRIEYTERTTTGAIRHGRFDRLENE